MPSGGDPIIVGGGIGGGTPLVVGNFLKLQSSSPPLANTSARLIERATSVEVLGDGTTSTAIGNSADANGTNHIAIGTSVSTGGAAATRQMVIGDTITLGAASGNNSIVIGQCTFAGGTAGSDITVIGYNVSFALTGSSSVVIGTTASCGNSGNVVIGANATSSSTSNVVVGQASGAAGARSIVVGQGSTGTGTTTDIILVGQNITVPNLSNFIALGQGISPTGLATGDIVFGNNNLSGGGFTTRAVWGGANLHTNATAVPAFTHRHKNAQGTDITAGDATLIAPLATGNAAGGAFAFQTGPAGASGAVLQTATTRARIEPNGNITLCAAAGSYGSGVGVVFIGNAGTNPSTDPTGGGILYVNAGALTYRGSGGTVSVIAPA